jgi:hypothetical protein
VSKLEQLPVPGQLAALSGPKKGEFCWATTTQRLKAPLESDFEPSDADLWLPVQRLAFGLDPEIRSPLSEKSTEHSINFVVLDCDIRI